MKNLSSTKPWCTVRAPLKKLLPVSSGWPEKLVSIPHVKNTLFFIAKTCSWRYNIYYCVCVCLSVCLSVCVSVCISKIVNRKIPYNTQWQIFPREFPQLRLSELIEYSVGLPAATLKGNTPSQNPRLSAKLPCCARELTANLVFCS